MGRNIPYFASLTLFIIITAVTCRVSNFPGLVVLRFIQGVLGGPVLATGGASAGDLLSFPKIPYGLAFWGVAALSGPALGPLLSGFSVPLSSWRWSLYELLIMCGFCWLLLFCFLPETNADNILLKRAKRLRKSTGNENIRSDSEIKQGNLHFLKLLGTYLTTPFLVTIQDPSIAFINVYTGLIYGIFVSCIICAMALLLMTSSTRSSNPSHLSTEVSMVFLLESWVLYSSALLWPASLV
jgi:MFS transporter, DHA1 family, multidrug resistance protein